MTTKKCPKCNGTGTVTDYAALGAEHQRMRIAASLTLREVAEIMGISIGYLSDLEHGRKSWTIAKTEAYRRAIGAQA